MSKIQMELMELFECKIEEAFPDMDFSLKDRQYKDKLTLMNYHSFVEGIKAAQQIVTMDVIK